MHTLLHQPHRFNKAGEITRLCRSKWVLLEKRKNAAHQVLKTSNAEALYVLAVIVMTVVYRH